MEILDKDTEKHYPIRKNLTNPGQKFQKIPRISKIKKSPQTEVRRDCIEINQPIRGLD